MIFGLAAVKVVQFPTGIALILCIVGATSAKDPNDIEDQDTVKAGVVLYLIVFLLLCLLTVGAVVGQYTTAQRQEGKLLRAVVASLPLFVLRLSYSFLLVFSNSFQISAANNSTSSILVELFMARIEEMLIVLFFLWTGLTHNAVPEPENCTKRAAGEKMAYRLGRGDFGGGKLGMVGVGIAATMALFRTKERKEQNTSNVSNLHEMEGGLEVAELGAKQLHRHSA